MTRHAYSRLKGTILIAIVFLTLGTIFSIFHHIHTKTYHQQTTTKIGIIGDSISRGAVATPLTEARASAVQMNLLGSEYEEVNVAVPGSTSSQWANDAMNGEAILTDALNEFRAKEVKIVQIMLGTNDRCINASRYKDNMLDIIKALKTADIDTIIIHTVPGAKSWTLQTCQAFRDANKQLVNEAAGVYLGDEAAYEYFINHHDELADDVHPTTLGHRHLGEFWAQAFKRVHIQTGKNQVEIKRLESLLQ